MHFKERLNAYLAEIKTNQKSLAAAAGLSPATVSRYVSGTREPEKDSGNIRKLAGGIAALSGGKLSGETVLRELNETVRKGSVGDYESFLANLNLLLQRTGMRGSELARALNYDASHISKILSGTRRPGNVRQFAEDAAEAVALKAAGSPGIADLAALVGADPKETGSLSDLRERITDWLGAGNAPKKEEPVPHFLEKLDAFDLNEYLAAIRFDEISVPEAVYPLPESRTYYGLREMMEAELDFMRATLLSDSKEDLILYSDMPLAEMAADPEFPKKWLLGLVLLLKKGLRLIVIHDVNRPAGEMMVGLESYIPLYMTGRIVPYCLSVPQGSVFMHLLKVSGAAALEGSAIAGRQAGGRYVLCRGEAEVKHFRQRAKDLLGKTRPLMKIYRGEQREAFYEMLRGLPAEEMRTTASCLPPELMSEELLERILTRTETCGAAKDAIREYRKKGQKRLFSFLNNGVPVTISLPELSAETFAEAGVRLALSGLFLESEIGCTFGEYLAYLEDARALAAEHPGLTILTNPVQTFRSINYTVIGDKMVIVSKEKSPAIHFVICHSKMVQAFGNFIPPFT